MFLIEFEDENDLETILEGRPWHFRKQVVIFDRLTEYFDRSRIRLVETPLWLKVGLYPMECDKKVPMRLERHLGDPPI